MQLRSLDGEGSCRTEKIYTFSSCVTTNNSIPCIVSALFNNAALASTCGWTVQWKEVTKFLSSQVTLTASGIVWQKVIWSYKTFTI